MVNYTAKYMKTLVLFICVFAFHNLAQAQKENISNVVAHLAGNEEVSLTQKFDFLKSISINFVSGNTTSPSNLNYTLRYPDTDSYIAMSISGLSDEGAESIPEIVLDFEQETRITFMSFGDIKMARTCKLSDSQKDISIINLIPGNLKKTGKSQDILGYNSTEYKLTDGDFKGSIWLTASLDESLKKSFNDLGLNYKSADSNSPSGYIMRVEANNKITKEVMQLNVSDINTNDAYSIDAGTYVTTSSSTH